MNEFELTVKPFLFTLLFRFIKLFIKHYLIYFIRNCLTCSSTIISFFLHFYYFYSISSKFIFHYSHYNLFINFLFFLLFQKF